MVSAFDAMLPGRRFRRKGAGGPHRSAVKSGEHYFMKRFHEPEIGVGDNSVRERTGGTHGTSGSPLVYVDFCP